MFKFSKRVVSLGVAATVATLVASTGYASAAIIAYDVPASTAGNQEWEGSLGMDFDVNSAITVTHLGAFDDNSDGINRTVGVTIYNRDTMMPLLPALPFGAGGTLIGGSVFQTIAPLTLMAGFKGTIVAFNYGPGERNGNVGIGALAGTTNDGGGLISFVGTSRYSAGNGWPEIVDGGPEYRYRAGTFMYEAARVPEPGTLALFGLGLAGLGYARRRNSA